MRQNKKQKPHIVVLFLDARTNKEAKHAFEWEETLEEFLNKRCNEFY